VSLRRNGVARGKPSTAEAIVSRRDCVRLRGSGHDPANPPRAPGRRDFRPEVLQPAIHVTVGFYPDGALGEVFVDIAKSGADIASVVRDAGVVISLALQHGITVADLQHAVSRDSSGAAVSILGAIVDCISTKTFSGDVR